MAKRPFVKSDVKKLVKSYCKKLEQKDIPIQKIYLFGSYAKGHPRADSDIDICIISPIFQDKVEGTMTLMKLRGDDELLLSPVGFRPDEFVNENPFVWEVKQTGEALSL